jgi:hypothetical protein
MSLLRDLFAVVWSEMTPEDCAARQAERGREAASRRDALRVQLEAHRAVWDPRPVHNTETVVPFPLGGRPKVLQ